MCGPACEPPPGHFSVRELWRLSQRVQVGRFRVDSVKTEGTYAAFKTCISALLLLHFFSQLFVSLSLVAWCYDFRLSSQVSSSTPSSKLNALQAALQAFARLKDKPEGECHNRCPTTASESSHI